MFNLYFFNYGVEYLFIHLLGIFISFSPYCFFILFACFFLFFFFSSFSFWPVRSMKHVKVLWPSQVCYQLLSSWSFTILFLFIKYIFLYKMFHFYVVKVTFMSYELMVKKILPLPIPRFWTVWIIFLMVCIIGILHLNRWSIWNVFYVRGRSSIFLLYKQVYSPNIIC